jgi:hypothetical protein
MASAPSGPISFRYKLRREKESMSKEKKGCEDLLLEISQSIVPKESLSKGHSSLRTDLIVTKTENRK